MKDAPDPGSDPNSNPGSDGPGDLLNAAIQMLSPAAQGRGVTAKLNGYVNGARDARKTHSTKVQTFKPRRERLSRQCLRGTVQRFGNRVRRLRFALPESLPERPPDLPLISTCPGSDRRLVRSAVETGAAGLVIEDVGAGNVDAESLATIQGRARQGASGGHREPRAPRGGGADLWR